MQDCFTFAYCLLVFIREDLSVVTLTNSLKSTHLTSGLSEYERCAAKEGQPLKFSLCLITLAWEQLFQPAV